MEIFAQRVRTLRLERGAKQKEMAELLGIGVSAYQCYEKAIHYPGVANLIKLADFFQVSVDYLVGCSDEK